MNLWIRSQDKKRLLKCDCLKVEYQTAIIQTDLYKRHCEPIGWVIENNSILIGIYKTKERALEVLDEIQDVLMPKIKVLQSVNAENNIDDLVFRPTIQECDKVELLQYSDYVYEMPKE